MQKNTKKRNKIRLLECSNCQTKSKGKRKEQNEMWRCSMCGAYNYYKK